MGSDNKNKGALVDTGRKECCGGADDPAETAECLLKCLLKLFSDGHPTTITYIAAYECLFGERPEPWRNFRYCPPVLAVAAATSEHVLASLEGAMLDTFIVTQADGLPGGHHFDDRTYTLHQWRGVLGGARVLTTAAEIRSLCGK